MDAAIASGPLRDGNDFVSQVLTSRVDVTPANKTV
jgi:hypothetical protein